MIVHNDIVVLTICGEGTNLCGPDGLSMALDC